MVSADGSASKIIGKEQVEERREVETVVFFFFSLLVIISAHAGLVGLSPR